MTTIQDVIDNTPEGQKAVEKAMRESIKDQNLTIEIAKRQKRIDAKREQLAKLKEGKRSI